MLRLILTTKVNRINSKKELKIASFESELKKMIGKLSLEKTCRSKELQN